MSDVEALTLQARARIGKTLRGKWRIDALLGVGGMAAVYAGTHRNGKRGAIKMMHAEYSSDTELRERFLREGYLANKVTHRGVVAVFDDDVAEDGSVFVVMELLEGETVEERVTRAPLTVGEVMGIAERLLDVLACAHAAGIVHRDIKPENVFLTREGELKILDFGIARLREARLTKATKQGESMGTPAFMPPEQAFGKWDQVDARTDVWAVGATVLYLLTGRFVHEGRSVQELMLAIMSKPAPPIRTIRPDLPDSVAVIVDRALAFEQGGRWPNAASMRDAIKALVLRDKDRKALPAISTLVSSGRQPTNSPVSTDPRPAGVKSSLPTRVSFLLLGSTLVVGLVIALWLAVGSRGPATPERGAAAPPTATPEPSAPTPSVAARTAEAAPPATVSAGGEAQAAPTASASSSAGSRAAPRPPAGPRPGPQKQPQGPTKDPFSRW